MYLNGISKIWNNRQYFHYEYQKNYSIFAPIYEGNSMSLKNISRALNNGVDFNRHNKLVY